MFRIGPFLLGVICIANWVLDAHGLAVPKIGYQHNQNPYDPGDCNSVTQGSMRMVKNRNHLNKLLLCIKQGTQFQWKMMTVAGNSYGNYFDPAKDCSSILDKMPDAKSGVYWIKTTSGLKKAWCDLVTDGGGFLLIGVQNSSRTMDVPSDDTLVHPLDLRHWSSAFGEQKILDFRVQIATSKSWSDTKAHWYYRFNKPRKLSNLLQFKDGKCDKHHPGIGDVKFVKDLNNNMVVTKNFECSRFDVHFHKRVGWGKMNECFRTPCKTGFDYLNLANSGAFSFSVESGKSGILNYSTKFIGCENDKCCACYGPSSDKDYCAPGCKAINGGTVLTDNDNTEIHAWYWVRTSLPKRVWKKCMEYEKISEGGKVLKWHVDEHTKVPEEGPCSYPGDVRFNDGVAVVNDQETMEKLPDIKGLLSFRNDDQKLWLNSKHRWNSIAEEKQVLALQMKISKLEKKNKIYPSCKDALETVSDAKHGVYKIKSPSTFNGYSNVYCHMTSLPGCSGGGWTLVMKINGKKETFRYRSSYWSNKGAYNPGGGMTAFDDQETKLPTYWEMPFKEICLGMKVNNDLNFISFPYQASSLYDIIADGSYRPTHIGRWKWLALIQGSGLQSNPCRREGFNIYAPNPWTPDTSRVRIGAVGNEGDDQCNSPDSFIGFGGISKSRRAKHCGVPNTSNTCGNAAYCNGGQNIDIPAMGYIFVR